jgi:hypothetical protein
MSLARSVYSLYCTFKHKIRYAVHFICSFDILMRYFEYGVTVGAMVIFYVEKVIP